MKPGVPGIRAWPSSSKRLSTPSPIGCSSPDGLCRTAKKEEYSTTLKVLSILFSFQRGGRCRSAVDGQDRSPDPLPIPLVQRLLADFRERRDVSRQDGVRVVAVEGNGRCPPEAASGRTDGAERVHVFGDQPAAFHKLVELVPVEDRTPLAVVSLFPPTFEVRILVL